MIVTHKLSMELTHMDNSLQIDAVQNDSGSRLLVLSLLENGEPWTIPQYAKVRVRYLCPDGTGGEYDTLSDGTVAGSTEGNQLRVYLEPALFWTAGVVHCHLVLLLDELQLYSFPIRILVQPVAMPLDAEPEHIAAGYRLPGPESAAVGQYILVAEVDAQGRVTRTEAGELSDLPVAEEVRF